MTIRHKYSGKLDLPGGTSDPGESAQCTAHRETWEETGFNVEVGELLATKESGFQFYACSLAGGFTGEINEFPVPEWAKSEVTGIQLVDPFVIDAESLRFEEDLLLIRQMFNQVPRPQ